MSLTISVTDIGRVTVAEPVGRLTLGEGSSLFRNTIKDLVAHNKKWIVLNLAGVSYIDASGIGELVSAFTTVANHGGSLVLLSPTLRIQDQLQLTKLYTLFEVYDSLQAAVRALAQ